MLHDAYKREKEYWLWKSRIQWLKEKDKNSKFFHAVTCERRRRDRIACIQSDEWEVIKGEEKVAKNVAKFYEGLFTTASPRDCEEILEGIQKTISECMNRKLTRSVEDQEIKQALFSMHPTKAPGPDGMTLSFFQKYWSIVGPDICSAVKAFFPFKSFALCL